MGRLYLNECPAVAIGVGGNMLVDELVGDNNPVMKAFSQRKFNEVAGKMVGFVNKYNFQETTVVPGSGPQFGVERDEMEKENQSIFGEKHIISPEIVSEKVSKKISEMMTKAIISSGRKSGYVLNFVGVDVDDPVFSSSPDKEIGFWTDAGGSRDVKNSRVDNGRVREVVYSPTPRYIRSVDEIGKQVLKKVIMVCCAGGGVTEAFEADNIDMRVVDDCINRTKYLKDRSFKKVGLKEYSVFDKDRLLAMLVDEKLLGKDLAVFVTDSRQLSIGWENKENPGERIGKMNVEELRRRLSDGDFGEKGGVMPKVESMVKSIENGAKYAVWTDIDGLAHIADDWSAGTVIHP